MATEADAIDQQRRIITATQTSVRELLDVLNRLDDHINSYVRLGLGDAQIRKDEAFEGTGTGAAEYSAAMSSIDAFQSLLDQGHGTNLERFGR